MMRRMEVAIEDGQLWAIGVIGIRSVRHKNNRF